MAVLGRLWAGRAFGTNTGNLFAEFDERDGRFTGDLRFHDDRLGVVVYDVAGTFDGRDLRIVGRPRNVVAGVQAGDLTANAALIPPGRFRGEWKTTAETAGTFDLWPHDLNILVPADGAPPPQILTATAALGSIRLDAEDIPDLIEIVSSDFSTGRATVSYKDQQGRELLKFADDFLRAGSTVAETREMRIQIQEPDQSGGSRSVNVQLSAIGANEIRVQGVQATWVLGKLQEVESYLKIKQNPITTLYRRFGIDFNGFLFFAFIALAPVIENLWARVGFAFFVMALLAILAWIHRHLAPNASIQLKPAAPGVGRAIGTQFASLIVNITAALVSGVILYWLTRS